MAHRSRGSRGQKVLHMFHSICLYNAVRLNVPKCPLCSGELMRINDKQGNRPSAIFKVQ